MPVAFPCSRSFALCFWRARSLSFRSLRCPLRALFALSALSSRSLCEFPLPARFAVRVLFALPFLCAFLAYSPRALLNSPSIRLCIYSHSQPMWGTTTMARAIR